MKKGLISVIIAFFLVIIFTIPAFAGYHTLPRLVDNANLLTDYEESSLIKKLDEISNRRQCDVAIVTVYSLDGKTPEEYADDFYDYNGYGMGANDDGILLLVSMEYRDWQITTYGNGTRFFNGDGIEYLSDKFLDDLSDGDYYEAFNKFADGCDKIINDPDIVKNTLGFFPHLLISIVIGAIVGFISVSIMKSKLKSVKSQNYAASYIKNNSFKVTQQRDLFLYRNVSRHEIQRSNDNSSRGGGMHTSSSGRSHGGGGGKF